MITVNWIHLSDLHVGVSGQSWDWPTMEYELISDIRRLYRLNASPWDLVFFTGDLTQSAEKEQFDKVSKILDTILSVIEGLQKYRPVLLAVPGNHDLKRPHRDRFPAELNQLKVWSEDERLRTGFWTNKSHTSRKAVERIFANYAVWWNSWVKNQDLVRRLEYRAGLLPGDFSAVLTKGGYKVGIIGLNTSMMHLGDEECWSKMVLGTAQIQELCGHNHYEWFQQHIHSVLLTHHPVDWLSEGSSRDYYTNIAPQDRFLTHFYGHVHLANNRTVSDDTVTYRFSQGACLFGERNPKDDSNRLFGYSTGALAIDEDMSTLRFWPRQAIATKPQGSFVLMQRPIKNAQSDQGTIAEAVSSPFRQEVSDNPSVRQVDPNSTSVSLVGIKSNELIPRSAGSPYESSEYVDRISEGNRAFECLNNRGKIAMIVGPPRYGKSTFTNYLLDSCKRTDAAQAKNTLVIRITLPPRDSVMLHDYQDYLHHVASEIAIKTQSRDCLDSEWKLSGSVGTKLMSFLHAGVLSRAHNRWGTATGRIFLVIDRLEFALALKNMEEFLSLLRSFAEEEDDPLWHPLRIIVQSQATKSDYLEKCEFRQSPVVNALEQIHLQPFGEKQLRFLLRRYKVDCDEKSMENLHSQFGGHPYFTRLILDEARERNNLSEALQTCRSKDSYLRAKIREHYSWVYQDLELMRVLSRFVQPDKPLELPASVSQTLLRAGLLKRASDESELYWACTMFPQCLFR